MAKRLSKGQKKRLKKRQVNAMARRMERVILNGIPDGPLTFPTFPFKPGDAELAKVEIMKYRMPRQNWQ